MFNERFAGLAGKIGEKKKAFLENAKPNWLRRRDAEKKLKEQGWERFDDFRIQQIHIKKVAKENTQREYRLDFETPFTKEVISGQVVLEAFILGDTPVTMNWSIDIQSMEGLNKMVKKSIVWDTPFCWSKEGEREYPYCSDERDPAVPHSVMKRGEIFGLNEEYRKTEETRDWPYYSAPIKSFFINISKGVAKEILEYISRYVIPDKAIESKYDDVVFNYNSQISLNDDENLRRELGDSLEAGTVDGKFIYFLGGAENFLALSKDEEYRVASSEEKLLESSASEISETIGGEIVDLGCGDGTKARIILEALKEKGGAVKYRPVDISPHMIFEAAANLPKGVEVEGEIMDFTNPFAGQIKIKDRATFLLLGNTLGNGDHEYQKRLLKNIAEAMREDDSALVGVQLDFDFNKILAMYQTPGSAEFARPILENLGISRDEASIDIQGDKEKREIKIVVKILKDKTIQGKRRSIFLPAGKEITLIVSHKYAVGEMEELANAAGLKIEKTFENTEKSYALFLLSKKSKDTTA